MPIPRPKILTALTVPTGEWAWDIDLSDAAQYDTNITGTVPAGTYFIAGDNQDDDLLFALQTAIQAEIDTAGLDGFVASWVNSSHKIVIQFCGDAFGDTAGDNDVRLNFSSWATDLLSALGYDGSSDPSSTATDYPSFTADWHHAYGWYSDQDGQLRNIRAADDNSTFTIQARSISGKVKSQFFGDHYESMMDLQHLERDLDGRTKIYSDGKGYGEAPVWPYNRNEPLECWWREARKGTRFRVYEDAYLATASAADTGFSDDAAATTITDSDKSWSVEPYRWPGRIVEIDLFSSTPQRFYIASHTATVITVANAHPSGLNADGTSELAVNATFANFTGDDPDNWNVYETGSGAVTECGTGEDHTGAGSGSVNLYGDGGFATIDQTISGLAVGDEVRVEVVISAVTSGNLVIQEASGYFTAQTPAVPGTINISFIATATSMNLILAVADGSEATVDSVSVMSAGRYYIYEHTYRTYVLDIGKMSEFRPRELPVIDEYNISIPLMRYVS